MYINLPNKDYFAPKEVANFLDVTQQSIYNWIQTGKLPAEKFSPTLVRISRQVLLNFIKEHRVIVGKMIE